MDNDERLARVKFEKLACFIGEAVIYLALENQETRRENILTFIQQAHLDAEEKPWDEEKQALAQLAAKLLQ
ncbi:hypothetical protein LU196_17800 [Pantoea sp. Mb-10]|uniref:hypothetical protein n=1 Tax=unclassified Pantoea TaxID=2630326 RepID=UPI001E34D6AF|nr:MULTISPECIES: hypothetical protein [unclassified Pantoea]MCE0491891.1 hypothetical protein [Pantoea sp. Mb-10]MCE0503371.1 hypothetical protein [Pantoea sp. Pb-8]